jgi:hypothetical protein
MTPKISLRRQKVLMKRYEKEQADKETLEAREKEVAAIVGKYMKDLRPHMTQIQWGFEKYCREHGGGEGRNCGYGSRTKCEMKANFCIPMEYGAQIDLQLGNNAPTRKFLTVLVGEGYLNDGFG